MTPRFVALLALLLPALACGQTTTDPTPVGGALQKVVPSVTTPRAAIQPQPLPVKPNVPAPGAVVPADIDRAFDVEENVANLDRADAGEEEEDPIQGVTKLDEEIQPAGLGKPKVTPNPAIRLPGNSPGAKPINPGAKPYSPPPTDP